MKLKLILPFIIFTNYCFSQADATNQLITYSTTFYKIQYPKSWSLDTSRQMGSDLFLFSPIENETDKFRENVNVLIQPLNGQDITLEKYKQNTEMQIRETATNGEIFESTIKMGSERSFYSITYAMTQGQFRLKFTSVCFIHNGKAYLATFSTEFSNYEIYKRTGEQILASFSLTK